MTPEEGMSFGLIGYALLCAFLALSVPSLVLGVCGILLPLATALALAS